MLVTYFVNVRLLNDHLFGKELFSLCTASAFRKLLSIYVFSYFPLGFEDRMWILIASVPDHCCSFYYTRQKFYSAVHFFFNFLKNQKNSPVSVDIHRQADMAVILITKGFN